MRRSMLLMALLPGALACEDPREWRARSAVRQLVKATPSTEQVLLERVAAFGEFVLPDLEQEMHGTDPVTRLRLLEAIRRIGTRRADPLLRFFARWDKNPAVRKEAKAILKARPGPRR